MTLANRKASTQAPDVRELEQTITAHVRALGPEVTTPVQVLDARVGKSGVDCDITVCWLVPLGDEGLAGICIPAPTGAKVSLTTAGDLESAQVDPPGSDVEREVRAWAQGLLANGLVRGVEPSGPRYGPPARPTHELVEEDGCPRVLRRIGYAA
jgi:hypothetical protein